MTENSLNNRNLTLDEIVFDKRNKDYGAYDLRKTYPKVLTKAFVFGTLIFVIAAFTPVILTKIKDIVGKDKQEVKANLINIQEEEPIFEQPKEEEPPPPPPPPKEEPKVEVIQNVVPEPKKAPKVETPPPPISDQLKTTTGLQNQEGEKKPTYTPPPPPPSTGVTKTIETPKIDENKVYASVDQSAEYPGGMGALRKYLSDNFDTSLFDGGEGKLSATLKFVVERDGTVSDVKVITPSGNRDFDGEASRVVKKLKKWSPGKVDGQNVRSFYSVPFSMVFE